MPAKSSSSFFQRSSGLLARFFIDPLSVKELSGIARRWQTYVGRGLYVALIGLIVWIFWTSLSARGTRLTPSAYAELAHGLFIWFIVLQMIVSTLGGISAGSDMVTREIRNGTLGILALTPLSSWRIAAGKWKAAMVQTSTGVLCGLPVFAICTYLGGMGLWEFVYSVVLSIDCAALGAAIGLFCSTVFRTGYAATTVSIVFVLMYCVVPNFLFFFRDLGNEAMFTFLSWIHPLYAAIGAVSQGTFGKRMAEQACGWIPATIVVWAQVWMLLRWSARRVETLVFQAGGSVGGVSASSAAASPKLRTSGFARFLRGGETVWQRNAILWKELSTRRFGLAARIGLAILLCMLLTTVVEDAGAWRVLLYWVSWIVLLLTAIASGVSLFVTEREERKWDVLLCTPLRAHQIVGAKLIAGLAGLAPMAGLLAAFWALSERFVGVTVVGVTMNLVSLAEVVLLAYVLGAAASLLARSQRVAFSSSFGIVVGLLFVFPIVLLMLQSFAVFTRDQEFAEYVIGVTNPAMYMAHVSGPLVWGSRWGDFSGTQDSREQELWRMFQVYVAFYAALISLVVIWMMRNFDRATGRR